MFQVLLASAEFVLTWVVHAAWQAGLLAAAVVVLTWLLGSRLQARWRFALWLVVFARLAMPVLPAAPWSMFQLVSVRSVRGDVRMAHSSATWPLVISDESADGTDRMLTESAPPQSAAQTPPARDAAELAILDSKSSGYSRVSLIHIVALVWLTGVAILSLRLVASNWQLRRRRQLWQEVADPKILSLLRDCRREMQLRRTVALFTTAENLGPATCGIVRPGIVLPRRLQGALLPAELRLVLLHELVHVWRHDVLVDHLASCLVIVHWFHPVAWTARYFLRRERELACDAAVLDLAASTVADDYGRTLLKTVESLTRPAVLPGLVGMFGGGPFALLARRIRQIAEHRRTTWRGLLVGGILLAVLALVGLTDAQTKGPSSNRAQKVAEAKDKPEAKAGSEIKVATTKEARQSEEEGVYEAPITVFGVAHDPLGRPIAGAEVILAAVRPGYQQIAEGKTAADGTYRFEKIPLPIKRADTNAGHDAGGFEIFGIAEGYALAWRPQKWFYPDRKQYRERLAFGENPAGYGTEDPIELDLTFTSPTTIRGRIVDDLGQPIPKTKLAIRYADPGWDQPDLNTFFHRGSLNSLNEQAIVPPRIKTRVTDADGRFEFAGLPADHRWWIDVIAPGHPPRKIHVVTHDGIDADAKGNRVYSGDFEVVFPRPHLVKLRVVYGDTGEPASKVGVGGGVGVAGFWETTDEDGFVEGPLPDGRFQISLVPRYGTPYLRTSFETIVSAESVKEPTTVKLRPAAVVEIKVVDADTAGPLSGADVWSEEMVPGAATRQRRVHGYRSWEVETRISHYEAPRSDKDGKMRVLFEPGVRRIGVGLEAYPRGYEPIDSNGKEIDCQPGAPATVEFQMRNKAAPAAQPVKAQPVSAVVAPTKEPLARVFSQTISGRALDEQGRPIEGATIYLVKTNGYEKVLAQVKTDASGRYEFRDAPLESNGIGPWFEMAYFRVVGQAPGKAFAWRGMKNLFIDPVVAKRAGMRPDFKGTPDPRLTGFVLGERIELDLTFHPPKPITGRIVNDRGAPVKGVQVTLMQCDYIDAGGKPINEHESFRIWVWMTRRAPFVMPDQLYAITDDDGKFELPSAPLGVVCNLGLAHPSYATVTHYTSTADNPPATLHDSPVLKLPLEITLSAVLAVPVQIVLADTDEPAAHVRLDANEMSAGQRLPGGGTSAGGESDKDGKLTLKLPPGKYRLLGHPPPGIAYLRTAQELTVDESTTREPVTLQLERGCSLILKAVDADTGKPIQGVTFRSADKNRFSFMELSPTQTNEQGEVRCTVTPGAGRYEFGAELPDGYRADPQEDRKGRTINLPAGGTVQETFKLRK